ncbi:hypothetical protein LZ32DRAFT_309033 [Colletotrichum eremochloae]|nr:hypothetical protein LZ32DRAFT_309033 [Colletotrichum eremochloae]
MPHAPALPRLAMLSRRLSGRGAPLWGVLNSTGNGTHNAISSPMPKCCLFFFFFLSSSLSGFPSLHSCIQPFASQRCAA